MNIYDNKPTSLDGKKVTVLGMGVSGMGAVKLLRHLDAEIFISDNNTHNDKKKSAFFNKLGITYETGGHTEKVFDCDFIVVSPGISKKVNVIQKALNLKIPLVSEVELGSWFTQAPIIAITGSNGKTTTTKLLGSMCNAEKINSIIAGNIGVSFSEKVMEDLIDDKNNRIFILEISSFQTEYLIHFKPHISVYLNISPDHLNRHGTINNYLKAKIKLASNQDNSSFLVYNENDEMIKNSINSLSGKQIPFSLNKDQSYRFGLNETKLIKNNHEKFISLNKINLIGKHNYSNIIAAATTAHLLGVSDENIAEAICNFSPVPHRLEKFCLHEGIQFVNDSKATNIDAVKSALLSFDQPIILIMGGYYKGGNFNDLLPHTRNIKTIITYGEAQDLINAALGNAVRLKSIDSLKDAAILSQKIAEPGDVVLLSPGCASFDQFNSFEERGEKFKQWIKSNNC